MAYKKEFECLDKEPHLRDIFITRQVLCRSVGNVMLNSGGQNERTNAGGMLPEYDTKFSTLEFEHDKQVAHVLLKSVSVCPRYCCYGTSSINRRFLRKRRGKKPGACPAFAKLQDECLGQPLRTVS